MSIFVNLAGGLGNQLFQIANGFAYANHYKKNLFITRTWGGIREDRPSYWDTFFKKIASYAKDPSEFRYQIHYREQYPKKEIPEFLENVFLEGYFQSEYYFSDYKEEIRKLFYIPLEIPLSKPTVAVHIRRGDFLVESHFHKNIGKDYYDISKKVIEEKLGFRPKYIYFSDDPGWVKYAFQDDLKEDDIVREGYKDYEDLILMMNCHHFIMANSTFSWWGTWLSQSKDKIVITPKIWRESAGDFKKFIYWQTSLTEGGTGIVLSQNPPSYSDPLSWEDIYCEGWIRI